MGKRKQGQNSNASREKEEQFRRSKEKEVNTYQVKNNILTQLNRKIGNRVKENGFVNDENSSFHYKLAGGNAPIMEKAKPLKSNLPTRQPLQPSS